MHRLPSYLVHLPNFHVPHTCFCDLESFSNRMNKCPIMLQLIEGAIKIFSHLGMYPVPKLITQCSFFSTLVKEHQQTITHLQFCVKNFEKAIDILNSWNMFSNQICYDFLCLVGRDTVKQTHEFCENPIQCGNYVCRILQIWIYPVSEMCSVAFVSYVVDGSQATRDMNSY